MDCTCQRYNAVPAIWPMAKFTSGERGQIEIILPGIAECGAFSQRQNGRESFGRPKYRLPVEWLLRISCEKTTPICLGRGEVSYPIAQQLSDS